jgi:hypothetical protein
MGIDQSEQQRRRQADKPKYSSKHPIAAIEKRVLDSPAFADLKFSARAVLLLLCRNVEKGRNGHIQLSERQADENGIERKTLRRALRDLVAHQIIVMTWRGGKVQGSCNKYALTWLPIKDRQGIHVEQFQLDAWKRWKPLEEEKTGCQKRPPDSAENVPLKEISNPKMSPTPRGNKGLIEVIAIPDKKVGSWIPAYDALLEARKLGGHQCFRIPEIYQ